MSWLGSILLSLAIAAGACGLTLATGSGAAVQAKLPATLWCAALAFGLQWIAFVPAYARRSEHFYDLLGALTYLSCMAPALLLSPISSRSLLVAGMVAVWSLRLGSFLFARVRRRGKDGRFDAIKNNGPRFLLAWTLQGLWVTMTLAAALVSISASTSPPLQWSDLVGSLLWLSGFAMEVVADAQKKRFQGDPANQDRFIEEGLWSWSQHPNYAGELLLWIGIALIATASMQGWNWLGLLSPLFVYLLLTRVSGIPLLAERAEKRWGQDPAYQSYKRRTSMLIPRPPKKQQLEGPLDLRQT